MKFDSDVQGPALRRPLRPGRRPGALREGRDPARRRSSSTTGSRAPPSSWTSTSRSSSGSTGGSSSPPSHAVPAALRRLLLQPRRRVGQGRRDQLQEAGASPSPTRPACSTSSAASSPSIRPAVLADRHLGLEELLGLRREPGLQDRRLDRRRPRGHRQQERRLLLNIGPEPGRHHPRARGGDAAARSARGWRSTARRSTARGPGRSSARGRPRSSEGSFNDTKRKPFTAAGRPLHDARRQALRDRAGAGRPMGRS